MNSPEGRAQAFWPRMWASWLYHFLAAGAWARFPSNAPTFLSVKGGDASRTVSGGCEGLKETRGRKCSAHSPLDTESTRTWWVTEGSETAFPRDFQNLPKGDEM